MRLKIILFTKVKSWKYKRNPISTLWNSSIDSLKGFIKNKKSFLNTLLARLNLKIIYKSKLRIYQISINFSKLLLLLKPKRKAGTHRNFCQRIKIFIIKIKTKISKQSGFGLYKLKKSEYGIKVQEKIIFCDSLIWGQIWQKRKN